MEDEIELVAELAYLTEEERREIVACLNRRNGVFQDPDCDLALASLGNDRAWVEQALRYPPIYYADVTRRHEFRLAMTSLGEAISRIQYRKRDCCAD